MVRGEEGRRDGGEGEREQDVGRGRKEPEEEGMMELGEER